MFKRLLLLAALLFSAHAQAAIIGNPVVAQQSPAAESSHVFATASANLYSAQLTTGGSAGYLMVFNATTAPADGAVTPALCLYAAANTSLPLNFAFPVPFSTGITFVFSTTGCFTKTASATAFFSAQTR
jgi:hypothetical protein